MRVIEIRIPTTWGELLQRLNFSRACLLPHRRLRPGEEYLHRGANYDGHLGCSCGWRASWLPSWPR